MSSLLAELAVTCNALGYCDTTTGKYYADSNTLEAVKDLIRFLRRDDESHEIRRHLGETQVLRTDLLPLLQSYWQKTDLFDVVLRLLVNLTSPALMLWREEVPLERSARNHYLQIEDHLQTYKQAFANESVWVVLSSKLSKLLEMDFIERGDENNLVIERILILIRNVLFIPIDKDLEQRPDNDASIHDQVLWALHQSGMLDVVLFISSSSREQSFYMHVLEINFYLLRDQNPTDLANAAPQRSQTEKLRDEAKLLEVRHYESIQKQQKVKMYTGARHSRFGGSFVVKSMKSISDNELIYHKPLNRLDDVNFDYEKIKLKPPKNRLPIKKTESERRSAFSIRLFLKDFCLEFLNGSYNSLMHHVRHNLLSNKAQPHDESYYLWAIKFFMEFNRCYKFQVELVSETMSIESFHFVQQQMEKYFDAISSEKKSVASWSRRLHFAVLTYRELLMTIIYMDKSNDEDIKNSTKVIQSNIFYVVEYRELIITLLVTFDELKMSLAYLKDVMETQHVFLKAFQLFCEKYGSVVVQKKMRIKKKRKIKATNIKGSSPINLNVEWEEIASQLSTILTDTSFMPTDLMLFDSTSELTDEEKKLRLMKNIQNCLQKREFEKSLGLLRVAREFWPENDFFKNSVMNKEEELLTLRDIFFADLEDELQNADSLEDIQINEEEMEKCDNMTETNYQYSDFIKRFCNPKIVRTCGVALRNFAQNSTYTNHCIIKLLHRIVWDCKMVGMVFQLSIFRTLQKIYVHKKQPQFKELVEFATYLLRKFFEIVNVNPKIFIETLFWKTSQDAYDIEYGYGSYKESRSATLKNSWSEIEENEIKQLFLEYQEMEVMEDVADWITNNLINNTRTRRVVLKKLKELGLIAGNKKSFKFGHGVKLSSNWSEEEENQLQELYEKFKNAVDPLVCIMNRLTVTRSKNKIVEQLLKMGLLQDKTDIIKKCTRTLQNKRRGIETENSDSGSDTIVFQSQSHQKRNSVKKTQIEVKKSLKSKQFTVSKAKLINLLKKVADMTEPLKWLQESFSDIADDYEDNQDESKEDIPLVAASDYAISAMENDDFVNVLLAFGVKEPADEQETFWRIPNHLGSNILQQYCGLIRDILNKKDVEDQTYQNDHSCSIDETTSIDFEKHENDLDIENNLRNINENVSPYDKTFFPDNIQYTHCTSVSMASGKEIEKDCTNENTIIISGNNCKHKSISEIAKRGCKRRRAFLSSDSEDNFSD